MNSTNQCPSSQVQATDGGNPYGDSYEALPAKGRLPALILSASPTESRHPAHSHLKHYIQGTRHGQRFSFPNLLAAIYVAILRVRRVLLASRGCRVLERHICTPLQRIVTWAYLASVR